MSKTVEFLESLSIQELAFFVHYKRLTYSKPTQEIIDQYLMEKGYTPKELERYITSPKKEKAIESDFVCPRCGSHKIRYDAIEVQPNSRHSTVLDIVALGVAEPKIETTYHKICNVCEHWLNDPNNEKTKTSWVSDTIDVLMKFFR